MAAPLNPRRLRPDAARGGLDPAPFGDMLHIEPMAETDSGRSGMSEGQRTAIVTGAAGGIGRAVVRGLLDAGIRVAASDRTEEGLKALEASARERGREAA